MENQADVQPIVGVQAEKTMKHILIVEGDLLFSVRIETTLKKLGYRTTVIGNGAKALTHIAESTAETAPALVIANFGSGRLDPLPFLEELKSLPNPPLVLGFVPHGRLPEMRPLLKAVGCDLLVANSAIAAHLPKLVARLLPDSSTGNAPAPDANVLAAIETEADTED